VGFVFFLWVYILLLKILLNSSSKVVVGEFYVSLTMASVIFLSSLVAYCHWFATIPLIQDYKKNAFLEADKQCSNTIQNMEKKIRVACSAPGVKVYAVIQVIVQEGMHESVW
jgi:hypothetical protein